MGPAPRISAERHTAGPWPETPIYQTLTKTIADGLVCEHPRWLGKTEGRCRCCGGAFCEQHVQKGVPGETAAVRWPPGDELNRYRMPAVGIHAFNGSSSNAHLSAPKPYGLCVSCSDERNMEAYKEYCAICDAHPGLEKIGSSGSYTPINLTSTSYRARWEIKRRKFQQRAENERAEQVVEECIAKIDNKAREIQRRQGGCSRADGSDSARHMILTRDAWPLRQYTPEEKRWLP
jgi:hypothetical protein